MNERERQDADWNAAVSAAVDCILNTRDLCGDEKRATVEMLVDDFKLSRGHALTAYRLANFEANRQWNESQRQAGVKEKYLW